MFKRDGTRKERTERKINSSQTLNFGLVCINFMFDDNIAFIVRTAACFGAKYVAVIGSVPNRRTLLAKSGANIDYTEIKYFSNPSEYLDFARKNDVDIVSAELCNDSKNIYDFEFDKIKHTDIILGHETTGVPSEILFHSKKVFIPMNGFGYCLNTSQTGNIFAYEYVKQINLR